MGRGLAEWSPMALPYNRFDRHLDAANVSGKHMHSIAMPQRAQRRLRDMLLVIAAAVAVCTATAVAAPPPYEGTIFMDPNVITSADPSAFSGVTYAGRGIRKMFDRRVGAEVTLDAYLFNVTYSDGLQVEFGVNPEFRSVAAAQTQVEYYAPIFGRLPKVLRQDVLTFWIHEGDNVFGGGSSNVLVHTGSFAQDYIARGVMEEVMAHEAAHASLDPHHGRDSGWLAAQAADPGFISTYALSEPEREDVAESFVPWLALRLPGRRVDAQTAQTILANIPHRIAYLDAQNFDLSPYFRTEVNVVEYYNASLDHYFITHVIAEMDKLDSGELKGWKRTGQSFSAYASPQPGTSAVCRIYIPPGSGDGHFFGRDTSECDNTMRKNPMFVLESAAFLHLYLPQLGTCASGQVPVYRVYSNRVDANHRYTSDRPTRDAMVAMGWAAEGDGADVVAMCAPP